MRFLVRRAGLVTFAALTLTAGTLPVWSVGCGARSACFVYSQAEYSVHQNACPAQSNALVFFTDPSCAGPVVSVDGEGSFTMNQDNPDQSFCCYPVTQQDISQDDLAGDCMPPGAGGAGGFGAGGATTSFDSTTVVGVGGGTMGCFNNCNVLLSGANPKFVCGGAANVWASLLQCACDNASTCLKVCQLNICGGHAMTSDCLACLEDPMSNCSMEVAACQAD